MKDNLRRINALTKMFGIKDFRTMLINEFSITIFCNDNIDVKKLILQLYKFKFSASVDTDGKCLIFKRNNIYIYV